MDTRRHELLKKLEEAAASVPAESPSYDCGAICFRVMYGLPWELQMRVACFMIERYLPIFETKHPGVTWPRQITEDVEGWHRVNGRGTEDTPEGADLADRSYTFCFHALLSAYHHKADPASLTAGTCCAIGHAAFAKAQNVWIADDPQGALMREKMLEYYTTAEDCRPSEPPFSSEQEFDPEHHSYDNVAFVAVYRREWARAAAWLTAEAVWQYPEPDDLDAMMRALQRWNDHDHLPMGPERADPTTLPD
jgi:hypothetical protein